MQTHITEQGRRSCAERMLARTGHNTGGLSNGRGDGHEKRYQGKRDTAPWDNDPLAQSSGKWNKGDRTGWETQLKARQQGQNEDRRIYQ